MKIQLVLLTNFLFSCAWSEDSDLHGEDIIDPSDMLHYDAVSQTMRSSKQKKINALLKEFLRSMVEDAEQLTQLAADEDSLCRAEISFNLRILRDLIKFHKKNDGDPTLLEEHLRNIHYRFTADEDDSTHEETLDLAFERFLQVTVCLFSIVGFLDLVMSFERFWTAVRQWWQSQRLGVAVQEVPVAAVYDVGPGAELQ